MKRAFNHVSKYVFIMFVLLLFSGSVFADKNQSSENDKKAIEANQNAVTYIATLVDNERIPTTYVDVWNEDNLHARYKNFLVSLDVFGGVYIDEENNVNINVTNYDTAHLLKSNLDKSKGQPSVLVHIVKYTAFELETTHLTLVEGGILDLDGAVGIGAIISENRVAITVIEGQYNEHHIMQFAKKLGIDEAVLTFEIIKEEEAPRSLANIGTTIKLTATGKKQ